MGFKNLFFQGYKKAAIPFDLAVVFDQIDGVTYVQKFGENPLVTTATDPEDIWEGGGVYPFSASGVADIVSISSSDAGDTVPILITGLDVNGDEVTQVAVLQGQTRVALTTPLWRVYRMENVSNTGTSLIGIVYCYSGTEATDGVPSGASIEKARIINGNNQTQMAIYTVPKDKVAFLRRGEVNFGYSGVPGAGTQQVKFCFLVRSPGNVFKIKKTVHCISTGNTMHYDVRPFADPIPALSDIKTCVYETTADVAVDSTFHMWLFDKSFFSTSFLAKIGMTP